MKSSNIMIVIAAVLMAASFAGIAMVDDEADAEVGTKVTYTFNSQSYTDTVTLEGDSTTTILKGFNEVFPTADGEYFLGWKIGDTIVVAGSPVSLADGDVTAEAEFLKYTVSFVDSKGTALVDVEPISATPGKVITLPEFVDNEPSIVPADKQFAGWKIDGTVYAAGSEYTITKAVSAVPEFNDGYSVTLVAGDITTTEKSLNNKLTHVYVPSKTGHSFAGWYDAEGKMYFDAKGDICDGVKITSDITLTAKFDADQLTITLMEGDTVYGAPVTVLYGNAINAPELPAGCAYWAVMIKEAVLDDAGKVVEPAVYERFDFSKAITANMTLYAIASEETPDESIYATFNIEGTIYGPYKVTDRFSIPQTDREGYNFLGWTVQGGDGTKLTSAQVQNYQYTEDVTFVAVYEVAEPPAPEEPGFFETNTGKTVAVVIAFVIVLFVAALYLNLWGLRSKLFGWKIERKGKE